MCCATTARVNDIGEKVCCTYGDTEIGMPVFMDDISADAEEIRKRKSAKERVQQGTVLETDKYKYQGMVINTEGNLKDHIQEM